MPDLSDTEYHQRIRTLIAHVAPTLFDGEQVEIGDGELLGLYDGESHTLELFSETSAE